MLPLRSALRTHARSFGTGRSVRADAHEPTGIRVRPPAVRGLLVLALALAASGGGCAGPERPEPAAPTAEVELVGPPAPDAELLAIAQGQAIRIRALRTLESRGVVEFRWRERGGERFEQCDLRLFAVPPARTAFRLSKLGEQYAWLGSDEESWWLFRLKDRPSTVEIRPWAEAGAEGFAIVSPRTVLLLAGLVAFPDDGSLRRVTATLPETVVLEHPLADAEGSASELSVRWTVAARTRLPQEVAIVDRSGQTLLASRLADYAAAPSTGASPGDWPRVPRKIEVVRTADGASIRLALDEPSARSDRIRPQFFELPELLRSLRPDEVVYRTDSVVVPADARP